MYWGEPDGAGVTPSGVGDGVGVPETEVAPGTGGPHDGAGVGGPWGVGLGLGVGDADDEGPGEAAGVGGGVTAEPVAPPGGGAENWAYAGWPPTIARAAANAIARPLNFKVWQTKRLGGLSLDNIPYLSGFRPIRGPP